MGREEPEGLYPEHRIDVTEKIAKLTSTGESFCLKAPSGMGKSKYMRYVCASPAIAKKYFAPAKIKLYYLDLNRVYKRSTEQLIEEMALVTGEEGDEEAELVGIISKKLGKFSRIYVILDQAELLQEFDTGAVRFLRSLRDQFKYKFSYIICLETGLEPEERNFKYLMNIAPGCVEMGPLSENEMGEMINRQCANLEIELSDKEKELIKKVSKGVPKTIKKMLSDKLITGGIETSAEVRVDDVGEFNSDDLCKTVQKFLTKNEYLFFQELCRNCPNTVARDDFARLLSPESAGEGVSNEAIDQVVSRLRKTLDGMKVKVPYKITNKRGVGYYLA